MYTPYGILISKFHLRMKCLHVFFCFFHLCLFDEFIPDEISSRQKRVNSKRHFTTDRNDFIPGRVSSPDEISRVNTLLQNLLVEISSFTMLQCRSHTNKEGYLL